MKIFSKKRCCFCSIVLLIILVAFIVIRSDVYAYGFDLPYFSFLSVDEHIERLTTQTKNNFANELNDGTIVDFKVDLMYDCDDKPRFFIVELEYKDPILLEYSCYTPDGSTISHCTKLETNYVYFLGRITLFGFKYIRYYGNFYAMSPFSNTENFDKKKYFLNFTYAIQDGENIVLIFDGACSHEHYDNSIEKLQNICPDCCGNIITDLNENRFKMPYHYKFYFNEDY